jgi:hypothetical protein
MEKMINFVAEAVAGERRPFQDIRRENTAPANEAGELREKLRSVFKEYDIILSENYTLRAKAKQLAGRIQELENAGSAASPVDSVLARPAAAPKPAMRLYEDTRLISDPNHLEDLDDESGDAVSR